MSWRAPQLGQIRIDAVVVFAALRLEGDAKAPLVSAGRADAELAINLDLLPVPLTSGVSRSPV